jgi:response regulator RpfG family c-di-GMP phosphodiesterase
VLENSNILLVDDNQEIIRLLSDFLEPNKCDILVAESGKQALGILEDHEVDIVILDIGLPDSDGITLLDKIKVRCPDTSVIMMTGYHDYNLVIDAMKRGASDFLMKPFELDKLMLTILRVSKERELLHERQSILSCLEDKREIEMLNRELRSKIDELSTMYHISNRLSSLKICEDVYEKIIQTISEVLDHRSCCYYVVDLDNNQLLLYREKTNANRPANEKTINIPRDLLGKPLLPAKHFIKDDRFFLPVEIRGECVGYIAVSNKAKENGHPAKHRLMDRDVYFLKIIVEKASMQIENWMLYESLFENIIHTLTSLVTAVNRRDLYTEGHCNRVTDLCLRLAEITGLSQYDKQVLRIACPLHDVGKIGIPDSILLKPEALTADEYATMKWHSAYGEEIIGRFDILFNEARIIRHHHERFDGAGYPDGLQENDIPLCSRAIAICDAFDAMTTTRPYRPPMKTGDALAEIKRCKGKQFDGDIADRFIAMMSDPIDG